ncbi:hypothetical protein BpHYR1_053864, partial [Brachionus plicatilis]
MDDDLSILMFDSLLINEVLIMMQSPDSQIFAKALSQDLNTSFISIERHLKNIDSSIKIKVNLISTTPNEVKKSRISDSGEGCFKALGSILRASSN